MEDRLLDLELLMRFYVCTAFQNSRAHNVVRDALRGHGHEITLDWTSGMPEEDPEKIGILEVDAVLEADFVCVLLPGGRGTHVELGVALGRRIPVLLHAREEADLLDVHGMTSPFYHHPQVARIHGSLSEYVEKVLAWCRTGEFGE